VAATLEARVVDASGTPLADAVVYAVPASGAHDSKSRSKIAIEQVDREFVPYVSVIQVGTTVTFPNRDPLLHHVYSFSPAKTFEIKLYQGRSPSEILFDKPGVVTLGCNIHDWMIAYVLVVTTPYFGKSGADGMVRLHDVPNGNYEVKAWHPRQRAQAPTRALALQESNAAEFSIEVTPRKPKYKPPMDRMRY
jgi:plastocyanin